MYTYVYIIIYIINNDTYAYIHTYYQPATCSLWTLVEQIAILYRSTPTTIPLVLYFMWLPSMSSILIYLAHPGISYFWVYRTSLLGFVLFDMSHWYLVYRVSTLDTSSYISYFMVSRTSCFLEFLGISYFLVSHTSWYRAFTGISLFLNVSNISRLIARTAWCLASPGIQYVMVSRNFLVALASFLVSRTSWYRILRWARRVIYRGCARFLITPREEVPPV